jgi:hypothetical protein
MRRILLGLTLLLPGCAYVGNPFDGFPGFIGDTHTIHRGVNAPSGDSINMRRARGQQMPEDPLLPEQGNIWPGPPPPEPTLSDLEKQQGNPVPPGEEFPRLPPPRGSTASPPGQVPGAPMSSIPTNPPVSPGAPSITASPPVVVQTDRGPATIQTDTNGIQTFQMPGGASGHVVNNGNGTMTLIGNDGRVFSAPAPR